MFITIVRLAKPKSKHVLVVCASMVSGHRVNLVRERLGDKMEFMQFDPYVQSMAYYKESKKLRSVKEWKGTNLYSKGYNSKTINDEFRRMQ